MWVCLSPSWAPHHNGFLSRSQPLVLNLWPQQRRYSVLIFSGRPKTNGLSMKICRWRWMHVKKINPPSKGQYWYENTQLYSKNLLMALHCLWLFSFVSIIISDYYRLLQLPFTSLFLSLAPAFSIGLFPSVSQCIAGKCIMAAIICVTVTACPLITEINYISVHFAIKHWSRLLPIAALFWLSSWNLSRTSLFFLGLVCLFLFAFLGYDDRYLFLDPNPQSSTM